MIVLHAGMAKAGSSSIQQWIARSSAVLASELDVQPMRIVQRADDAYEVVPCTPSRVLSLLVGVQDPYGPLEDVSSRRTAARQLCAQLAEQARRHKAIVLTHEAYQLPFWRPDPVFLHELDELARVHPVRVAYYVRPQHTAMEAAWRQWGFRQPMPPSRFLKRRMPQFDYLQTAEHVSELAPRVSFEIRPFHADLLEEGDVVIDFANTFLDAKGLVTDRARDARANRGFPLDLVMMLRQGGDRFWTSLHDNETFDQLREIVTGWDIPESQEAERSRVILQHFCHCRFEPGNQRLIARLGWNTQYFIPPIDDGSPGTGTGEPTLEALDDLWTSKASDTVRELVFSALSELLPSQPDAGPTAKG